MPIALGRKLKLDIPIVAQFVAERNGAPLARLLEELQESFGCRRRAAQDALAILVSGGWLTRSAAKNDRRQKHYFLTQQGGDDLCSARGRREMRCARWRYSTTSTKARKRRGIEPHLAPEPLLDALTKGKTCRLTPPASHTFKQMRRKDYHGSHSGQVQQNSGLYRVVTRGYPICRTCFPSASIAHSPFPLSFT